MKRMVSCKSTGCAFVVSTLEDGRVALTFESPAGQSVAIRLHQNAASKLAVLLKEAVAELAGRGEEPSRAVREAKNKYGGQKPVATTPKPTQPPPSRTRKEP